MNYKLKTIKPSCVQTVSRILIMGLFAILIQPVYAYDGDVDYNAPYLTVDPETGKLVTIDPKAQTKTPHDSSAAVTGTGSPATDNTTVADAEALMAQASSAGTDMEPSTASATATGYVSFLTGGIIIALIVLSFIVILKRRKSAVTSASESADS